MRREGGWRLALIAAVYFRRMPGITNLW